MEVGARSVVYILQRAEIHSRYMAFAGCSIEQENGCTNTTYLMKDPSVLVSVQPCAPPEDMMSQCFQATAVYM